MQGYEISVILNAILNESDLEKLLLKVKSLIENKGGKIHHEVAWGRKKLAYEIKKQTQGYYHVFYATGSGEMLDDFLLQCSYDTQILKVYVIKTKDIQKSYDSFQSLLENPMINADLYIQSENREDNG